MSLHYTPKNVIPYDRELNALTGSVLASILMAQLNYWFDKYPDGFYKFLEPSNHPAYRPGTSWVEELGMTVTEFRTAFDAIGHRFTSKTKFAQAEQESTDKFFGRFFASYIDKRSNMTYYVRNHVLVNEKLHQISLKVSSRDQESSSPRNEKKQSPEVVKPDLQEIQSTELVYTETTGQRIKNNNYKQEQQTQQISNVGNSGGSSCDFSDLYFPQFNEKELASIKIALQNCPTADQQPILDELEGLRRLNKVQSPIGLTKRLVVAAVKGEFTQSAGISVEIERETKKQHERAIAKVKEAEIVDIVGIAAGRDGAMAALSQLKRNSGKPGALTH